MGSAAKPALANRSVPATIRDLRACKNPILNCKARQRKKKARVALATRASLLGETVYQNRARLLGERRQIHVSR